MNGLSGSLRSWHLTRQFKRGNWHRELVDAVNTKLATTSNHGTRHDLLGILLATTPLKQLPANLLDDWATELRKQKPNKQSANLAALIATVYFLQNRQSDATALAVQVLEHQPDVLNRYPATISLLETVSHKTSLPLTLHETMELQKRLNERLLEFDTFRSNNTIKSVAVVGNSPSILNGRHGKLIDSADCVIRFNHVVTGGDLSAAVGTKTDVWVATPSHYRENHNKQSDEMPAGNIWVSSYLPYLRPSRFWSRIADLPAESFIQYRHSNWLDLVRQVQAPPSAGLLILSALAESPCEINAFGFTRQETPETPNHWADRQKKSTRHNWQAEHKVLNELARQRISFYEK